MFKSLLPWKHTKTKVMVPEQTMEHEPILEEHKLIPCSTCGRTFLLQPLKKHAPICEKNASKKRKIFDSLKQRVEGTDLAQFHQKSYIKKQDSTPKTAEKSKRASHWEENHRKLVDAIRSAKGVPRDMSPPKPKVQTVSSTQLNERCPHCDRQFGPKAFDRHVEWCKEHRTRIQKSPASILLAKERLEARTKYKVPPLNKPKRTVIKEKYSSPTIARTESVYSVKSTPTNAFRRNASVRKPKSVLDIGKKNESLNKKDEKANSVVTLNDIKKIEEQSKSSLSKRFCPPRAKVNLIHNENLESITVSPVKFVEIPAKKLVTWKEVSQKSPERPDDDPVIVVYENSNVFGKKDATSKQNFIEELKDLLKDSDEDESKANCSSCDTLHSEDCKISISPKSKSSPEFGREKSPLELLPMTKSQPISADEVEKFVNSASEDSFDEDSSELSISIREEKRTNTPDTDENACLKTFQNFGRDVYYTKSSDEFIFGNFRGKDAEEASIQDFDKFVSDDEKNVCSVDDILANFSLDELEASNSLIHTAHDIQEDRNNTNLTEKTLEDSFSLTSIHTIEKFLERSGSPSLKSTSDHSFLSSKSLVNADDTQFQQSPKESARIPTQSNFGSEFTFSKTILYNPFSPMYEGGKYLATIEEYEVPKKRRKLNTTFILSRPSLVLRKTIASNKDEKEVTEHSAVNKSKTSFLPKIFQEGSKNVKVRENKPPSACKLPALETKQSKKVDSCVYDKRRGKNGIVPIKNDISDVFLSYPSDTPPYDPFINAERQFMELLECDTFKPITTPTKPHHRPYTAATNSVKLPANSVKLPAKKFVKSAGIPTNKRASVIDPPTCFQDPDAADDDFEILENLINDQFNNDEFYLNLNKQNKDEFNVILNQRKYSDDMSSVDSNLINENDNLSIPEHFKFGNYSTESSEDTDTTLQNDVDVYSVQYDLKIEPQANKGSVRKSSKVKSKLNSSFGSGDAAQKKAVKNATVGVERDKSKGRDTKNKVNKSQSTTKPQVIESTEPDLPMKPEDLFAVDDKMYAEYKIFEEMYLKEKEQMANSRKQRTKNSIKSYGIEIVNEDYTNQNSNKVSGDSAYGSLNRNSPKTKTTKLSPLQRQRIDSASSSGSEIFVPPVQNNQRMSKFCHECGNKYPVTTAKFCPECGVKRLLL